MGSVTVPIIRRSSASACVRASPWRVDGIRFGPIGRLIWLGPIHYLCPTRSPGRLSRGGRRAIRFPGTPAHHHIVRPDPDAPGTDRGTKLNENTLTQHNKIPCKEGKTESA